MRVLAIIGSPRKGNSFKIVQRIEEELIKLGNVEFQYLFLKDAHLETCRGCFACISKGEELCPLKDDRAEIESKMLTCDGVIFAAPNYCNGVPSIMKNLIDRMAYIGHRPRFFGLSALVVAVSAGPVGLKQTLFDLTYFAGGGFYIVKKLGVMIPPYPLGTKAKSRLEQQISNAARLFHRSMKNKERPAPSFIDLIHFRSFQTIYRNFPEYGKRYFPADYIYWTEKGWLNKSKYYFTDSKVSILKKLFGKMFEKILVLSTPKMLSMEKRPAG